MTAAPFANHGGVWVRPSVEPVTLLEAAERRIATLCDAHEEAFLRAEQAEQHRDELTGALRALVELLDGQTEPLHPVSWQVELIHAKAALLRPSTEPT